MGSFTTKARTVELLGRKQIRDSVTALAELMKNSYDADAPSLRVEFNTQAQTPRVIIADNGMGMNQQDVESKWLVLGTSSKTHRRVRETPSGRPLMGAKGIGRLAASAVGRQLWMFTKSKDSSWNIVFVHWGLFENPNISIHEIVVPTRFGITGNELILRFEAIVSEMKAEILRNLDNTAWNSTHDNDREFILTLREQIASDIGSTSILKNHISKFINGYKNGTILFIEKLHDNWDLYLSPMSGEARKNDPMTEKMHNRFASFVSTLDTTVSPSLPFNVEVYYNNKAWETEFGYTEEDYKVYDIKVDGRIEKGRFYGYLDACNADQHLVDICNQQLKEGLDVTAGIADWQDKDCGTFSIKFCHLEGSPNRSGLSVDDYNRIKEKLKVSCGICVYRDGVRILPYGEPENDFIGIEARRTEKAGRYIFSHRNIFGRIDINSAENPHLEDKSSREGLIENVYYHYFVKVIENLLVILAVDFISDVRIGSLAIQKSFVSKNLKRAEDEKIRQALEKKEAKLLKELTRKFDSWLKKSSEILLYHQQKVTSFCAKNTASVNLLSVNAGYNQLSMQIDQIQRDARRLHAEISSAEGEVLHIPLQFHHQFGDDRIQEVEVKNYQYLLELSRLHKIIDDKVDELIETLQSLINQWTATTSELISSDPESLREAHYALLSSLIDDHRNLLEEMATQSKRNRSSLLAELRPVEDYFHQLQNTYELEVSKEWSQAKQGIDMLASFRRDIDALFDKSPEDAAKCNADLLSRIEQVKISLSNSIMRLRLLDSEMHASHIAMQTKLKNAIAPEDGEVSDQQIIGFLRQENVRLESELEIYSDLANMGLAAEIVNHEFNQLFINVHNAIKNMKPYVKDASAKYWLDQITMGFRSISDRQNQLSPMYRTYSLRKAKTSLHQFVEEIRKFTDGELSRNAVTLENHVPKSIEVVISKSKIFPAISNLINNSVYWVLNQPERIIRIRYDEKARTLFIEDSGSGIIAAHKEKIFEPFVSYKPNGRGLGLTIAKKVLESQGHRLEIADDNEKTLSGACFKIIFAEDVIGE